MRFPKMHIAQSVTNRIMNIANKVQPATDMRLDQGYAVPNPAALGQAIEQTISTQLAPMAAPDGAEQTVAAAALEGTSSADALAMEGVLNDQT